MPSWPGKEKRLPFGYAIQFDRHSGPANCPNAAGCEENLSKQI